MIDLKTLFLIITYIDINIVLIINEMIKMDINITNQKLIICGLQGSGL